MKISAFKSLAIVALAAAPMLASAQLSANVSINSSYKFRGQDQTANKPALQGGFDYAHGSGAYVGIWNSNVTWLPGNSLETDIYGGYKGEAAGVGYDVGFIRYMYPGAGVANTNEVYAGVSLAGFGAKYYHTVSDDYFNAAGSALGSGLKGKGTGYLNVAYAQEIHPKWTLKASMGYTSYSSDITLPNYVDYSVGAVYDLGDGFSVSGAMVGATKKNSFLGKADGKSVNANTLVMMFTKKM